MATGKPLSVFGLPLHELRDRDHRDVPKVVVDTVRWLEIHALEETDVFKARGDMARVQAIRNAYDKNEEDPLQGCCNSHTVAAVLKYFLQILPEPPISYTAYQSWISDDATDINSECTYANVRQLAEALPRSSSALLEELLPLLRCLSDPPMVPDGSSLPRLGGHQASNNLAALFAPMLTRLPLGNIQRMAASANMATSVVAKLIQHHGSLFPGTASRYQRLQQQRAAKAAADGMGDDDLAMFVVSATSSPSTSPMRLAGAVPSRVPAVRSMPVLGVGVCCPHNGPSCGNLSRALEPARTVDGVSHELATGGDEWASFMTSGDDSGDAERLVCSMPWDSVVTGMAGGGAWPAHLVKGSDSPIVRYVDELATGTVLSTLFNDSDSLDMPMLKPWGKEAAQGDTYAGAISSMPTSTHSQLSLLPSLLAELSLPCTFDSATSVSGGTCPGAAGTQQAQVDARVAQDALVREVSLDSQEGEQLAAPSTQASLSPTASTQDPLHCQQGFHRDEHVFAASVAMEQGQGAAALTAPAAMGAGVVPVASAPCGSAALAPLGVGVGVSATVSALLERSRQKLVEEKAELKAMLRKWNEDFCTMHGREPEKADKEPMRVHYLRYHRLKRRLDKITLPSATGASICPSTSSSSLASSSDSSGKGDEDVHSWGGEPLGLRAGAMVDASRMPWASAQGNAMVARNGAVLSAKEPACARCDPSHAALGETKQQLQSILNAFEDELREKNGGAPISVQDKLVMGPVYREYKLIKERMITVEKTMCTCATLYSKASVGDTSNKENNITAAKNSAARLGW